MSPGINLGNTLEAVNLTGPYPYANSQETYWGNPAANQSVFNAYAAAGFKSVRIPVAWTEYADADNNIAPFWLARVKQVVDYARNAGLYVVINIHWDGGWMQPTYAQQTTADAKLTKFWTQIANEFASYDNHLLFAGTNEVAVDNVYTAPTAENCAVQTGFNQQFVNAVRATGGNNATRTLIVQGYSTNIDYTITNCNAALPTDSAANRLMMEIHYYDPYDFTINSSSNIWQWGSIATDPTATETWANESYVDAQMQKMKTAFVDKGVPVIMGEYGAYTKAAHPDETYTNYWAQYVTHSAFTHGVVPMWWDTGAIIDRTTGGQKDPTLITTIVNAAK
jgi:endoglucanase